jgi:hypothetical protein
MATPAPPPVEANPISLKVMRLCKPSFHFSIPVMCPSLQPPNGEPEPGIAIGGMLSLPQSFGDIYLGETFSCYISLVNISSTPLATVGLKVEVQTQLQRETLADSSIGGDAVEHFAPEQTLDKIIEYDLKDIGIHILICSALYTDRSGERKYFRKFFKFQVNNPLSMKSKTHALPLQNEVLVETQLQNSMPRQLFLKSVDFKPAQQFEVTSLNNFSPSLSVPPLIQHTVDAQEQGTGTSTGTAARAGAGAGAGRDAPSDASTVSDVGLPPFGHLAHIKSGDTQQYMFRLRGKVPPAQLRQVATLGRMDVVWTTAMGESGRLQSNTVQRKLPAARGVEVHLIQAPSEVEIEEPFEVKCAVCNTSGSEMQLQLTTAITSQASIVVDGVCTKVCRAIARAPLMLDFDIMPCRARRTLVRFDRTQLRRSRCASFLSNLGCKR